MRKATTSNGLILMLAFISGFSIMSIELLGGKVLAPYFGNSIYVWGSTITVFMVALSLGYLLGGNLSAHHPSLKQFARFYLFGALFLLPLIFAGKPIMDFTFLWIDDPRYGSLVAAILLFFIPTVILGMISPYAVRLMVKNEQHSGQIAGRLYFVSTLGSALGTLATSFYLVLWWEINTILLTLTALLLLAGIFAYRLDTAPLFHEVELDVD
ncbi:TPA: fused MFS/spermidine synthase [Vibrio vulnificus]|nr:glycosyl transferase [Vibrio vulnificus]HDY7599924.1 fused MFS/spermidine synthase [Vibrio vulnificus]HDY7709657.1 fused MFS/spermidine synthase [Vibrio vulnificus]HDY7967229.1 fused MFS/spermidine synthase [Vibrio vulnificus]